MTRRAPRVLVAGTLFGQPRGGVRRHNAELLPRAARLLCEGGGRLVVLAGREGLRIETPAPLEVLASDVPAHPPLRRARAEGGALREALEQAAHAGRPFDLVHTAHLPAPRELGVPFTLTLHDLRRLARWPGRWLARPFLSDAVSRAAGVVAVSRTVRDEIASRFGPRRSWVVPNAADHLEVLPRRVATQNPFLLHVGHIEPRKNLGLIVRALALDPSLPPLHLVGAPKGREDRRLLRLTRKLGVEARVRFLGPLPDPELPPLYAACSAAVFPSRIEGFGIGTLEAMLAGAPVAVARAGALPEVAGPEAPTFSPDDPGECARAIALARNTPRTLRIAARERARRYSWDASAQQLVALWSEVTGS